MLIITAGLADRVLSTLCAAAAGAAALCCCVQVIVQDVPLDNYISMRRFLAHFQPQACILMVRGFQAGACARTRLSFLGRAVQWQPAAAAASQAQCSSYITILPLPAAACRVVLQESPAWPVLVQCCAARGIRLGLLNARMSSRAFLSWFQPRVSRGLLRRMLGHFSLVVPQSDIVSVARSSGVCT